MRHFILTYDGRSIVALFEEHEGLTCSPWVRSIPEAEAALQNIRRDAWTSCVDVFLEMANDMADALAFAAELRIAAAAKRKAAAQIVDRSAA